MTTNKVTAGPDALIADLAGRDQLSPDWVPPLAAVPREMFTPARMWNEAEAAYQWWQARGAPAVEAWEFAITPDRQSVQLA